MGIIVFKSVWSPSKAFFAGAKPAVWADTGLVIKNTVKAAENAAILLRAVV